MMRFLAMLVLLAASTTAVRADSHLVDFSLPDAAGEVHRPVRAPRQVGRHQLLGDVVRTVHGGDPGAHALP